MLRNLSMACVLLVLLIHGLPGDAQASDLGDLEAPHAPEPGSLEAARAAARDDRHDEAIDEYRALLAGSWSQPSNWLTELGEQLLYAGRYSEAEDVLTQVLERRGTPAEARRAHLLLSRAQAWNDRQRASIHTLQAFVHHHPDDAEGAHHLAQSQFWMGRPDKAQAILRPHLASDPTSEIIELSRNIEQDAQTTSSVEHTESHQSDDLRIGKTRLSGDFVVNQGLTSLGPRVEYQRYEPKDGPIDRINVGRAGVDLRHRFVDDLEFNGELFFDLIDTEGGRADNGVVTFDLYGTWWASDLVRFDVGSSRTTFDNIESLRRGIVETGGYASVDLAPSHRTRLSAQARYGELSDGNSRIGWGVAAERRLFDEPTISAFVDYSDFEFEDELDNGYFNPSLYQSGSAGLSGYGSPMKDVFLGFEGSGGVEFERGSGSQFIWSAETNLSYALTDRLEAELSYGFFSSATGSSGGFERGTASAGLVTKW